MYSRHRQSVLLLAFSLCFLIFISGLYQSASAQRSTVLSTDVMPMSSRLRGKRPNGMEMRIWEKLPAPFYFNSSIESTFRLETNPYEAYVGGATDQVFRVTPQITAGWALTPNTQIFSNYFVLRDSLMHNTILNSTVQSIGGGIQHTVNLNKKLSFQPQVSMRELYQSNEPNVTDILPAVNLQYQFTPNFITYINSLFQIRFRHSLGIGLQELDTFQTIGCSYQRGPWTFLASTIFNQNFRNQFGANSLIPVNNYAFINDFEIDRQICKSIPGLQAILRIEPIFNFHSNRTVGLAGSDVRIYYGIRFSASKPALNDDMQQLRQRYVSHNQAPTASDLGPDP